MTRLAWTVCLGVGLLTASVLPASGVPQIMTEYGDQMPWLGAEINAMGNTGTVLYRGGTSNIFNPAMLIREDGHRLDLGVALDQQHEDRFVPIFDGFESYVTDVAIASNRHHYFNSGFAFAGRLLKGDFPLSVGVSLADRYPFTYTFEEEVRNPSGQPGNDRDAVLQARNREVTGILRNLSVGAGVDLLDRLSVGAAVHYAFGTRTEVNTVRDFEEPADSYNHRDEHALDGVNFTLGVRGVVTERVEIGFAWESQLNANGEFNTTRPDTLGDPIAPYEAEVRYPNAYRLGLAFRPRTDPRTVFSLEGEYKPWSELMDSETPRPDEGDRLEDTMDLRVGVEHTFYNGMPLRFGFRYYDSYADAEANASVFSAGVGAPFGNGMFSVSLELSKISSVQDHQFPYPEGDPLDPDYPFNADPQSRVEDTRFRIGVGYKVGF
jgi:hypothetical protein